MCIIGCITREVKGVWGRRASTECVRERVDGRDSQTKPIRRLPNAHLVGFTGKTDRFGWVLILAGKLRSNWIVTGFPNGASVFVPLIELCSGMTLVSTHCS